MQEKKTSALDGILAVLNIISTILAILTVVSLIIVFWDKISKAVPDIKRTFCKCSDKCSTKDFADFDDLGDFDDL
ncbi:MAG: hypothetical protein LBN97_03085 [Oscillospiraceae bacterium]|jgi:hypothetical protein|nr:hypothetical protein [Oscillospiraceae bacterium]